MVITQQPQVVPTDGAKGAKSETKVAATYFAAKYLDFSCKIFLSSAVSNRQTIPVRSLIKL